MHKLKTIVAMFLVLFFIVVITGYLFVTRNNGERVATTIVDVPTYNVYFPKTKARVHKAHETKKLSFACFVVIANGTKVVLACSDCGGRFLINRDLAECDICGEIAEYSSCIICKHRICRKHFAW